MPIYTCITYQACCDGCSKEYGKFSSVEEAQQAVKNDKNWKVIEGKVYCPTCAENPPKLTQKDIEDAIYAAKQYLKSKEENNENRN